MRNSSENNIQYGENVDVLFDFNENTEMFYEENNFPVLTDWRDLWLALSDFVDNAKFYGIYDADETFTILLNNGRLINIENSDPNSIFRVIKNFSYNNRPLFVIYGNSADTQFNFRDWEGLQALQEYTGWFDMTLYNDTWL